MTLVTSNWPHKEIKTTFQNQMINYQNEKQIIPWADILLHIHQYSIPSQ